MNPNNTQLKSAEEIAERLNEISTQRSIWPTDVKEHLLNAFKAGMTEAAKLVEQRADDYDKEHGHTDIKTGTREYPKNGDDYMIELCDINSLIISARDKKETL